MARTYRSADYQQYRMEYARPHRELEPQASEIAVVDEALSVLVAEGILPHARSAHQKILAHRQPVREELRRRVAGALGDGQRGCREREGGHRSVLAGS